jgi:hypothetical protein
MESNKGSLDGEKFDGLSALLARFTALRVGKPGGDGAEGAEASEQALLYADVDGATVAIADEVILFGVIARLVQAGLPLKFRTTPSPHKNGPAADGPSSPRAASFEAPSAAAQLESRKRVRGGTSLMNDSDEDDDEVDDNNDDDDKGVGTRCQTSPPKPRHAATKPKSRRRCEHVASFVDLDLATAAPLSAPHAQSIASYVGMNVSADGLIVSKPDLFEQLLQGRTVLARVRDTNGNVTTREL